MALGTHQRLTCFKMFQAHSGLLFVCRWLHLAKSWPKRHIHVSTTHLQMLSYKSECLKRLKTCEKHLKNIENIYAHQDTCSKPQPGKAWRAALVPSSRLAVPGGVMNRWSEAKDQVHTFCLSRSYKMQGPSKATHYNVSGTSKRSINWLAPNLIDFSNNPRIHISPNTLC